MIPQSTHYWRQFTFCLPHNTIQASEAYYTSYTVLSTSNTYLLFFSPIVLHSRLTPSRVFHLSVVGLLILWLYCFLKIELSVAFVFINNLLFFFQPEHLDCNTVSMLQVHLFQLTRSICRSSLPFIVFSNNPHWFQFLIQLYA